MTEATKAPKKTAKKAPKKASEGLYAVFATGGKQYLIQAGDRVKIEILPGEHKEGDTLTFENVLLTGMGGAELVMGNPFIKGSFVTATLRKIGRNKTVDVIKYKQKSRYFKKYGHRQPYFEVQIDSIK